MCIRDRPYRLQIFTYWTGLAFTGRSAACAPDIPTRPAAVPRSRLFTNSRVPYLSPPRHTILAAVLHQMTQQCGWVLWQKRRQVIIFIPDDLHVLGIASVSYTHLTLP